MAEACDYCKALSKCDVIHFVLLLCTNITLTQSILVRIRLCAFLTTRKHSILCVFYFLIDASTASASELLINSLLPFFPPSTALYTIGRRSVGKNVGSYVYYLPFEKTRKLPLEEAISASTHAFLPICFSLTNASGLANYAEGFEASLHRV